MILFRNNPLKGIHSPLVAQVPELMEVRHQHFGLKGTSQIIGEIGGRLVSCQAWLFDKTWTKYTHVAEYLHDLEKEVGKHGKLDEREEINGNPGLIKQSYPNCTYMGFEHISIAGHPPEILLDASKILLEDPDDDDDPIYWTAVKFNWFQTSPDRRPQG